MGNDGFFSWLGEAIGKVIRFIVDLLSTVLGGVWAAMDDFLHGLARAIGMDVSIFSFVVLILGLLLLFSGVRALLRKGIISGLILIFLGLVVMSWLIH
ncbi:hypothetical protein PSm6_25770 [Pseudomonas solani]|uniref:MFS transporter n=1 Tax=Pseudomonas solani TaxID=2731552 RepID=A0AAU7Y424_9PSED|nr:MULTISPECIES: hypothetical protein [Pseudomonas]EQM65891.1 hypothetical protein L682_27965 [Pseudomonas alcaligenes OT 69]MBB4818455.1 uncharacterized membrane protein YjjP (DUF1212 family) [Pseudomonas alcaligenes]MDN4143988.1 hypothetical protein [Pseudomonas tohonis]MCU9949473.1 hypothetical protein [Pseudomonas sp. PDM13]MDU9410825.1 hypothetical protein [Pseudomonas sp. zfem005]